MDRLLEVADVAAAAINAAWTGRGANDGAERSYGLQISLEELVGRKVLVIPIGDGEVERLDRATTIREYRLAVITVERCLETGLPSDDWMDQRLEFCREVVFDILNVDRKTEYLGTPATLYTESIDRPSAFDQDLYWDSNAFLCQIDVALREKVSG